MDQFELRYVQPGAQVLQLSRMLISRESADRSGSVEVSAEADQSVDDIVLITSE